MEKVTTEELPVAIIGAGPVGLAAAAQLASRKMRFVVLEQGSRVGEAMRRWSHVRMFSPWRYNVDRAAAKLLEETGWKTPDPESLPLGGDIVDAYLVPLAGHRAIAPHLRLGAAVESVGRQDLDKVVTGDRDRRPFELRLSDGSILLSRAVIDASGTWFSPNPAGSGGRRAIGERENESRIAYGIPDVLGEDRARYAGRKVLVVGGGHSAFNAILDLLRLADEAPDTRVTWALRRDTLEGIEGGGEADALPARGALGLAIAEAIAAGKIDVIAPFRIRAIRAAGSSLRIEGQRRGDETAVEADEIIVAAGFRPNLEMLREIRLELDPWLESARALGPLIDPNLHSCGTVRPHGARELAHPEKGFYIAGMKSYGRAPTFLMATGYEQVRSIVAALAGDAEAAARVELELPETGVCSAPQDRAGDDCCGASRPEPRGTNAAEAPSGGPGREPVAETHGAAKTACCG